MIDLNILSKTLRYELHYFGRLFKPFGLILLLILIAQSVILGIGDVQSFFANQIPGDWKFIKGLDTNASKILCILIISIPAILVWLRDSSERAKYKHELIEVVERGYVPYINSQLSNRISRYVKSKAQFTGNIRVSLFIPVRVKPFCWRLKIICGTSNITEQELSRLSFELGEGALGHTLLQVNPKEPFKAQVVNVSDVKAFPKGYKQISSNNAFLVGRLSAIVVVATLQSGSIVGLVAVDSDNLVDLSDLSNQEIHSYIFSWLDEKAKDIELLWRAKNHV